MKYLLLPFSILWQLPQDLIGLIIYLCLKCKYPQMTYTSDYIFLPLRFFGSGVSLGHFIFLERNRLCPTDAKHELGHRKQSQIFGWLYLPLFGLPSITANIIDRLCHKDWTYEQRIKWYYGKSHYWEYLADKWGHVASRW